jgi:phage gpG-like protein
MPNTNIKQAIDDIISTLKQRFDDISPVLKQVCSLIDIAIQRNFAEHGRWNGSGTDIFSGGSQHWKPLAKSTLKRYEKLGWEREPTLDRVSAGMRSSISNAYPVGKSSVGISVMSPYGLIHQVGGLINVPAHERVQRWKAKKTSSGKYSFRFAKNKARGSMIIERKTMTKAYSITIPARPYITLTPNDLQEIYLVIGQYLV